MSTLMTVGNSEGERRCDAKCYDAKHTDCDCVCGGRNHGVGLRQAQTNTMALSARMLKKAGIQINPIQTSFLEATP